MSKLLHTACNDPGVLLCLSWLVLRIGKLLLKLLLNNNYVTLMSQVIQVLLIQMKNNKNKAKKNNQKQSNTVQDISARIPDFLADKKKINHLKNRWALVSVANLISTRTFCGCSESLPGFRFLDAVQAVRRTSSSRTVPLGGL